MTIDSGQSRQLCLALLNREKCQVYANTSWCSREISRCASTYRLHCSTHWEHEGDGGDDDDNGIDTDMCKWSWILSIIVCAFSDGTSFGEEEELTGSDFRLCIFGLGARVCSAYAYICERTQVCVFWFSSSSAQNTAAAKSFIHIHSELGMAANKYNNNQNGENGMMRMVASGTNWILLLFSLST